MQELRFIAVDDAALIVSDEAGEQYRVVVDDALRDALRPRPHVRSEAPKVAPREIQLLIRAGRTVDEVVEQTGAAREYVERFEGPVLAERGHVVDQARAVKVRVQSDADPLDPESVTFGSVIDDRLEALGAESIEWDAWKDQEEGWRVGLAFVDDGIERDALWAFDPRARALSPRNPSAVTLSQQGELASLQAPRLRAVELDAGHAFGGANDGQITAGDGAPNIDFPLDDDPGATQPTERPDENGAGSGTADLDIPTRASDARGSRWVGAAVADIGQQRGDAPRDETADLLEQLRRRRGERSHQAFDEVDDESGDDARSMVDGEGETEAGDAVPPVRSSTVTSLASIRERSGRGHAEPDDGADSAEAPSTDSTDPPGDDELPDPTSGADETGSVRGVRAVDVPLEGLETPDEQEPKAHAFAGRASHGQAARGATGPVSRKRGRASLPSWDEIVFGTRS
ncbi:MAG: septation protein SepH, partial [Pseudoclavibacter sp.]